jgi:hypothetical protein
VHPADLVRYSLWTAVVGTALRNRKEYGVPTAWLTHLVGNTVTLLLPDALRLIHRLPVVPPAELRPLVRTIDRRVREDPAYAGYVAPLALGFVASHADYSIYHGRWAEHTVLGFGLDSIPHSTAAYALARLVSETTLTLQTELPQHHRLAAPATYAARHVDALAVFAVVVVSLVWEVSEYIAHHAEVEATGRDPSEVNMQWSLPDAVTDTLSNMFGLAAAIAVRHTRRSDNSGACLTQTRILELRCSISRSGRAWTHAIMLKALDW